MSSLYNIAAEFLALEEMLLGDGGELTETHEELSAIISTLLITKTDNYVAFVQKLEDEIELASAHIKRIQAYKKARESAIERLRDYAVKCMGMMGTEKITGEMGQISIRKPSTVLFVEDDSKIPEDFCHYERIIDKTKLKDFLKSGEKVDGASLGDGKKSVMFRLKGVK